MSVLVPPDLKQRSTKKHVQVAPLPVIETPKSKRFKRTSSRWSLLLGVFGMSIAALYLRRNVQQLRDNIIQSQPDPADPTLFRRDKMRYAIVDDQWHDRTPLDAKEIENGEAKKNFNPRLTLGSCQLTPKAAVAAKPELPTIRVAQNVLNNEELTSQEETEEMIPISSQQRPQTSDTTSTRVPVQALPRDPPKQRDNDTVKPKTSNDISAQLKLDQSIPRSFASSVKDKNKQNKVVSSTTQNAAFPSPTEKCTPWEISLDDWWQDHPTWEPSFENDTHACFRPIQNPQRVELLQKAHALQFNGCQPKPAIRHLFPMGFAATLLFHLTSSFWSAFRENRQFLPGIVHDQFQWLYTPNNQTSWAYCPTKDHECLYLPISNCPRPVGGKDERPKKKYQFRELETNQTLVEHNIWLSQYLMRPRQIVRQKLYEFLRDSQDTLLPQVSTPCTWIHVRRADAMTEVTYKRNYYFLQEYLVRGEISPNDNLLLFTDDQSTMEEARWLHPEYKWNYLERKRHRGPVPNNAHLPSGDVELEVLTILAERHLASQCQKGVFGNSNMATLFRNAMAVTQPGGLQNLTLIAIDRRALRAKRIEPEEFVKELDEQLNAARKKSKEEKAVVL